MTATIYIVTEVEDNILRKIEAFSTYEAAHTFMVKLYETEMDRCRKDGWKVSLSCDSFSAKIYDGMSARLGLTWNRIDFKISEV